MKSRFSLLTLLVALFSVAAVAQDKKMPSPPAKAEATIDGISVKIDYHQPSAKGRKIMGGLVPFGEVWRTGANATTTIELSAAAKIEGKELAAGKYGLYTVPGETEWTLIINKGIKWGAYDYKKEEDVLRVTAKAGKTASFVETFTIAIENNNIVLSWENTSVSFKVSK